MVTLQQIQELIQELTLQQLQEFAADMVEQQTIFRNEIASYKHYIEQNTSLLAKAKQCMNKDIVIRQVYELNSYLQHFFAESLQIEPSRDTLFADSIKRYNKRVNYAINHGASNVEHANALTSLVLKPAHVNKKETVNLELLLSVLREANEIHLLQENVKEVQEISTLTYTTSEKSLAILFPIIIRLMGIYNDLCMNGDENVAIVMGLEAKIEDAKQKLSSSQSNWDTVDAAIKLALDQLDKFDGMILGRKNIPAGLNLSSDDPKKMNQELDALAALIHLQKIVESGYFKILVDEFIDKFPIDNPPSATEAINNLAVIKPMITSYFEQFPLQQSQLEQQNKSFALFALKK